jgi:hypothetical protein
MYMNLTREFVVEETKRDEVSDSLLNSNLLDKSDLKSDETTFEHYSLNKDEVITGWK